ncbi:hypothetical protein [Alteribacter keqinensis]|uniref:Uncharacterized protein n=1 Tax=Alteribacter keqinensis TaxID=2483800 RepID=A0A3M7TY54_9BACI|nr:hypothetical protein [Alteribacter keqinensis]RNA70517.1 hypothetical protein EBO34_11520 [Alteribacter keqinensis]
MNSILKDKRNLFYFLLLFLIIILTTVAFYGLFKPLPEGVSFEGEEHTIADAQFTMTSPTRMKTVNGFTINLFTMRLLKSSTEQKAICFWICSCLTPTMTETTICPG